MKCNLLKTHLATREDCYELIKRKNLCLGCMRKLNNNDSGSHNCVLVVERPNKEKFSVLCPLNCRFAGTLLNRYWCRCAIKKLKANRAEISSTTTANHPPGGGANKEVPSASNVVFASASSSQIICNNIIMGSSCRASESLTVIDKHGRPHVACLLYDSGGSTTLARPSFSERAHFTRTPLNDVFTIVTETSREEVEAIKFSFLVNHPDGTDRQFEALNGSPFEKGAPLKFCLLPIPHDYQMAFSLPALYESCQDGHHLTIAVDCQHLLPQVIAIRDGLCIGLSQLTGNYIAWSTGSAWGAPPVYLHDDTIDEQCTCDYRWTFSFQMMA